MRLSLCSLGFFSHHTRIKALAESSFFGELVKSLTFFFVIVQIEKPLQKHGGRLEHNETYCGSCYGAEAVILLFFSLFSVMFIF